VIDPPLALSNPHRRQRLAAGLALLGVALLVVLISMAMAVYPGGSVILGDSDRYHFWGNFLSALGFTRTVTGTPNPVASYLFASALVLAAFCLLPLALAAPRRLFRATWPIRLSRVAGLASCTGIVLVGLCPYDVAPRWHMIGVALVFLPWFGISLGLLRTHWKMSVGRRLGLAVLPALITLHAAQGIRFAATGRFTQDMVVIQKLLVIWIIVLLVRDSIGVLRFHGESAPAPS
jgi:hypothetical protein